MTVSAENIPAVAPSNESGTFAIAVDKLTVWHHARVAAVNRLSMHVPVGSIYGLVGLNGAGKTTTLRVLATLEKPDAGAVIVNGIDIQTNPSAARGSIGYLPDFAGLYEALTVGEYLDFYGAIFGLSPRRRRQTTDELLELIGLTGRRNGNMKHLSRGMRQKVGLARCLVHDPRVLLLDEPASGMDAPSRLDLRDILQELARLGKTIVISSHVLSELAEVCSHLGVMHAGTMIAEGSLDDILDAVSPDTLVRVNLLSVHDAAAAQQLLAAHPVCHDVELRDAMTLVFRCTGRNHDLATALGHLAAHGVQVTEFAVERPTLEQALLGITAPGAQS